MEGKKGKTRKRVNTLRAIMRMSRSSTSSLFSRSSSSSRSKHPTPFQKHKQPSPIEKDPAPIESDAVLSEKQIEISSTSSSLDSDELAFNKSVVVEKPLYKLIHEYETSSCSPECMAFREAFLKSIAATITPTIKEKTERFMSHPQYFASSAQPQPFAKKLRVTIRFEQEKRPSSIHSVASLMASSKSANFRGFLYKKGNTLHKLTADYKKRFFEYVPQKNLLGYYKSKQRNEHKGAIDLSTVTRIRLTQEPSAPQKAIDVVTPARTWVLAPIDPADYSAFLSTLCAHVNPGTIDSDFEAFIPAWHSLPKPAPATVDVDVDSADAVGDVMARAFAAYPRAFKPEDYVLKVEGRREYLLLPELPFGEYACSEADRFSLVIVPKREVPPQRMEEAKLDRCRIPIDFSAFGDDCSTMIDAEWPFRLKIFSVHFGCAQHDGQRVHVRAWLACNNGEVEGSRLESCFSNVTRQKATFDSPFLTAPMLYSDLQPETKLCAAVVSEDGTAIACGCANVVDYARRLLQGDVTLSLFEGSLPLGHTPPGGFNQRARLRVKLDTFATRSSLVKPLSVPRGRALLKTQTDALVSKSGWMYKRGPSQYSKWKKRWFRLAESTQTLAYFAKKNAGLKGTIDLTSITAPPRTEDQYNVKYKTGKGSTGKVRSTHCFSFAVASGRTYIISCESARVRREWMVAIATVLKKRESGKRAPACATSWRKPWKRWNLASTTAAARSTSTPTSARSSPRASQRGATGRGAAAAAQAMAMAKSPRSSPFSSTRSF